MKLDIKENELKREIKTSKEIVKNILRYYVDTNKLTKEEIKEMKIDMEEDILYILIKNNYK